MISVGTYPTKSISLTLTWTGCWEAFVKWEGKALSGLITIDWRGWQLRGSVDPTRSGLFAGEPSAVIVGGLAWCTRREWRPFQSDRVEGVTAREVALSIAEQLAQPISVSLNRQLGKQFVPRTESGGSILSRLFGKDWHVGVDGTARAQKRSSAALRGVTVLNYDPRDGQTTVFTDRPDQVVLGGLLPKDERLKTSRRVTKLVALAKGDKERLTCYTEAA